MVEADGPLEPVEDLEKQKEIQNLSAEIESFVKLSNDDSVITEAKKIEEKPKTETTVEIITTVDNGTLSLEENKDHVMEKEEKKVEKVDDSVKMVEQITEVKVETQHVADDVDIRRNSMNTDETKSVIIEKKIIEKQEVVQVVNIQEDDDIEQIELPKTPLKPEEIPEPVNEYNAVETKRYQSPALRISDSLESLTEKDMEDSIKNPKTIKTENYEFEVRFRPLKASPHESHESRYETWTHENAGILRRNNSVELDSNGRRRSVKEIIESINKSQSLLKVNNGNDQKPEKKTSDEILAITESTDSLTRNLNSLLEDEKKINNFLAERESLDATRSGKYNDELNNNLNGNSMFEKCDLRIKEGLDWNPVPKPRRSRNFSEESK